MTTGHCPCAPAQVLGVHRGEISPPPHHPPPHYHLLFFNVPFLFHDWFPSSAAAFLSISISLVVLASFFFSGRGGGELAIKAGSRNKSGLLYRLLYILLLLPNTYSYYIPDDYTDIGREMFFYHSSAVI